jgi:GntR family transcriptional regulator
MMLDRPLYRMVAEQIEARISEGRYVAGTTLPTEPVLEQEFKVSRITIRQALGLLKRRGILGSRSGLGTFVRHDAIDHASLRLSGSLRQLVYYAAATRYTPLGRAVVVPPADIADYFEKERVERTLCFSGKRGLPGVGNFCFEQIYVAEQFGRGLDNARLGSSPLFNRLEELNGVKVSEVKQIITAVSARAALARQLGVQNRAAVLKAVRVYRLTDRRVAEVSVSHYDSTKFDYIMDLFAE